MTSHFRNQFRIKGNAALGVVALGILGGLSALMVNSIISTQKSERGISANYDFIGVRTTLNSLLEDSASCKLTGLIGYQFRSLSPLTGNPAIVMNIPGEAAAFAKVGQSINPNQKITELSFTSLVDLDPAAPLAAKYYFATINLQTTVTDSPTLSHQLAANFYVKLTIDRTKPNPTITDCFRFKPPVSVASAQCAKGYVATGIKEDGSLECMSASDRPDKDSGWLTMPFTYTHNLGTLNYWIYTEQRDNAASSPTPVTGRVNATFDAIGLTKHFSAPFLTIKKENSIRLDNITGVSETKSSISPWTSPKVRQARVLLYRY